MRNRVVITGMGVVTPLGSSIEELWSGLLQGKSGVGLITRFDTTQFPVRIAAEVKEFDCGDVIDKKEARRMDINEQYGIVACDMALKDSGLDLSAIDGDRVGVVTGSGIGGISTFEKQHSVLESSGPSKVSPFFIPMMIVDMCAGLISIKYGFRGPNYATVSACSSSAHAIVDSMRIIERGDADIMVCGGSEATITPTALAGFCQARALSTRNDEPQRASRPFDKDRDGFVMGEGAAILILESEQHASARGAKIYAEMKGAGMSGDAHHITAPHPEGYGARRAMMTAFADAGITGDQVDYINTHGTSTDLGDIAETKAVKEVLGEHARKIVLNSTKSMLGHLLGAAGSVETIVTALSIHHQLVHPTANLETPDPECDLDYNPQGQRNCSIRYALSNSFGFGGHNVSLLLGRYDGTA